MLRRSWEALGTAKRQFPGERRKNPSQVPWEVSSPRYHLLGVAGKGIGDAEIRESVGGLETCAHGQRGGSRTESPRWGRAHSAAGGQWLSVGAPSS